MDTLADYLRRCRNNNAVLFCGAGLTADCLNFDDDAAVGVTAHLLKLLNAELEAKGKPSGFRDIKNAAKRFKDDLGTHNLMLLLQQRFALNKVSASILDIVKYPWGAIYTTNYDNGIELALQGVGRRYTTLNNLESPDELYAGTRIIHLHGSAEKWNDKTFEVSCVLDSSSYYSLSSVKPWLNRLRYDIERADLVVFVGFSAADFHLSQVFFNASGLRDKAFFINRISSNPDVDELAIQEGFGKPLYIGREQFAQLAVQASEKQKITEPRLASFARREAVKPSASVPSVKDIENLFVWGREVPAHLKRDQDLARSDFHVWRNEVQLIQEAVSHPGSMVFVHGEICDGKTIAINDVANVLARSRPIFELRHAYADLVDETTVILANSPNAIFIIENCLSLHENRLLGIARQILTSSGGLILSARSISAEGEAGKLRALRGLRSFPEIRMGALQPAETDALIVLLDQIAGWRNFHTLSQADRRRFVTTECKARMPNVLLRLLDSDYVRDRYREEYNKIASVSPAQQRSVIGALLLSNIGLEAPTSFLSEIFELDFGMVIRRVTDASGELRLVEINGNTVRTIPSIGARNLLRNVIQAREVVNTTIHILEKLSESARRTDFDTHVFTQLMRYSILGSVVSDNDEVNRFFDHISKIDHFRRMPLFWLQWHIAMASQKRWSKANEYLEMGHTAADGFEKSQGRKFSRTQLNDRRAKFLVERASAEMRSGHDLFKDIKEALDIVWRLMGDQDVSHHPYETLLMIAELMQSRGSLIVDIQLQALQGLLRSVSDQATKRVSLAAGGQSNSRISSIQSRIAAAISPRSAGS